MKKALKNFGVSMDLCRGEVERFREEKDIAKAYLNVLSDFAGFVKENGFEIIEMTTISLIGARVLSKLVSDIKRVIAGFRMVTYHLPLGEINISALHSGIRKQAVEETEKQIDLCQGIGIDKVVMHPGCFAAMPDIYLLVKHQARETAKKSIFEVFDYCKKRNIELSIENLHRNEPLFQTPEEFEPFIEGGLRMVVDTVHAFQAKVDPVDFMKKFRGKISEVHLTDGVWEDPVTHYPLGAGEVDCVSLLEELEKIDFGGRLILEVESKEDLIRSKEFLREKGYL